MRIDVTELQRRYREMGDEELLALCPKDLTEEARLCHADELAARRLPTPEMPDEPAIKRTRRTGCKPVVARSLAERTKGDTRKPVLYLRSFWADKQVRENFIGIQRPKSISSEALFLLPFRKIGQVVAIDPPGEEEKLWSAQYANPALHLQPSDDWQTVFFEVLAQAQLVVIHAGLTPSLQWEVEEVFNHEPFVPTFLLLPETSAELAQSTGEIIKSAAGVDLPAAFFSSPVIFFPSRNEVLPIPRSGDDDLLNRRLNPFVGPLSRALETIHPGVRSDCFAAARSIRRVNVTLALALTVTSLLFYFMPHGCR